MKKWLVLYLFVLSLFILVGCAKKADSPKAQKTKPLMKVLVYYPSGEGIVGEEHEVPKSDNVPRAALEELVYGKPNGSKVYAFMPKGTKILDLKIENGLATVNFSREILNARVDAKSETLGIAAIVSTLTEFKEIDKVKILVEGRESGKLGDKTIEEWWGNWSLKHQPFQMK